MTQPSPGQFTPPNTANQNGDARHELYLQSIANYDAAVLSIGLVLKTLRPFGFLPFMKRLRIALLDDHPVVRHGLITHLQAEPEVELVGAYESSRELLRGMAQQPADMLLLDFALGRDEMDGVSLIRALRARFPECRILVLSGHHESATVALSLRVGARGFMGKDEDMSSLIKAIRIVASGAIYLSAEMSYQVADATTEPSRAPASATADDALQTASLSAREQEVIRCFLAGMTVSQIAGKFNRSIKTISSQKAAAFKKLGVTSDVGLFKIRQTFEE